MFSKVYGIQGYWYTAIHRLWLTIVAQLMVMVGIYEDLVMLCTKETTVCMLLAVVCGWSSVLDITWHYTTIGLYSFWCTIKCFIIDS